MSDKKNVGWIPLLKEHRYVGYDYMFDHLLPEVVHFDVSPLREEKANLEFGIYDLNRCQTDFYGSESLDDGLRMIKAACTLPIAGRIVDYQSHRFLDGGISVMIPLERALEKGCDRNIVIITKPEGYVRKPAGAFMRWLMKFNYPHYPKMVYDYTHRHENYKKQMARIEEEVKAGRSVLIRPSKSIPVKRFSGDPENLKKLYELGYQDMEAHREAIFALRQSGESSDR